jgi:hypothetical protein
LTPCDQPLCCWTPSWTLLIWRFLRTFT